MRDLGYPSPMPDFDFDAVIVGAGAVGLACGYALAKRGLTVAVLEQEASRNRRVACRRPGAGAIVRARECGTRPPTARGDSRS